MMFSIVGVSHHTAPIEVREKLAGDPEMWAKILVELRRELPEVMALATCNRVEVYAVLPDDHNAHKLATRVIALLGGDLVALDRHLYKHDGRDALRHLFRVAGSLDSLVVGETQIAGQLKTAFADAQTLGTTGPQLGQLMARAAEIGRRVRSQTAIGEAAVSVASVAIDLAKQIFGDLKRSSVLVVGAGKMGALAARHLKTHGAEKLFVCNRGEQRGRALADELGGTYRPLADVEPLLAEVDIVLCSTGAAQPVIPFDMAKRAMKKRRGRWLFLLDIALPRDVEPSVAKLDNVYLYDIDALQQVASDNRAQREAEATRGEAIVQEEVVRWEREERARGVVPTIKALRERFIAVADSEAERVVARLAAVGVGERERALVEALAHQIVNKLLHAPLTALKGTDEAETLLLAEALDRLFGLTETAPATENETPDVRAAAREKDR